MSAISDAKVEPLERTLYRRNPTSALQTTLLTPTTRQKVISSNSQQPSSSPQFFSRDGPGAELPSPTSVREQGAIQTPQSKGLTFGFRPVRYEQLGLVVKYGRAPQATVAEGQTLWALRRVLPAVPVPEVYGWTHDEGYVFIYMELVKGVTLEQRWDSLDQAERVEICQQLHDMILELRKLLHAPGDFLLGHINREPLGDIVFTNENHPPAGPFSSAAQFHDWMVMEIKRGIRHHWPGKELSEIPDPFRSQMPDEAEVVFTHADLHPDNIIVSGDSPSKVLAIIDWRQSGWYPDYWEFCKAIYTAEVGGEWMNVYLPLLLDEPDCLEAWEFYARSFGY